MIYNKKRDKNFMHLKRFSMEKYLSIYNPLNIHKFLLESNFS